MKLGHIVKYNNVFKFDNGLYHTILSGVITFGSWKFTIFDGVRSISQAVSIKILRNLVTLLSIILSSHNGLYRNMSSGVIALCSWTFTIFE